MLLKTFNGPLEEVSIDEAGAWSRDGFGERSFPNFTKPGNDVAGTSFVSDSRENPDIRRRS